MGNPEKELTPEELSVWEAVHTAVHKGKCSPDGWVDVAEIELTVPHRVVLNTSGTLATKGALELTGSEEKRKYRL